MASRLCFVTKLDTSFFEEKEIEFKYYNGFALSQKQKSIESFHGAINEVFPDKRVLEVSRKSANPIGNKLSAFNLELYNKKHGRNLPLECIFQSSKVFENGNQYEDLLLVEPIDAKRDLRLKNSGRIMSFNYDGIIYPNVPRTLFYDWIYVNALYQNRELLEEISDYEIYTDIEFNQNKSINCQARSCAIASSLNRQGLIDDYVSDLELFKSIYSNHEDSMYEQITLFK